MTKISALFYLCVISLALTGCLSSTLQHTNTGKVLTPGVTESRYGLATNRVYNCDDYNEDTKKCERTSGIDFYQPAISWRLGVREKWGPLTGVDIGWAIEFPGTLEFDSRFGLPTNSNDWQHNMAVGWGIGNWADNTWYSEYAVSINTVNFGKTDWDSSAHLTLWANYRLSWMATLLLDLEMNDLENDEDPSVFKSDKRFLNQWSTGIRLGPFKNYFLPSVFEFGYHIYSPTYMLTGSYLKDSQKPLPNYGSAFSIGFTWR